MAYVLCHLLSALLGADEHDDLLLLRYRVKDYVDDAVLGLVGDCLLAHGTGGSGAWGLVRGRGCVNSGA